MTRPGAPGDRWWRLLVAVFAALLTAGCAGPSMQSDAPASGSTSAAASSAPATGSAGTTVSSAAAPTSTPPAPTATPPAPTATATAPAATPTATPNSSATADARATAGADATRGAAAVRAVQRLGAGNTLLQAGNLNGALHEYATAQALAPQRADVRSAVGTAQALATASAQPAVPAAAGAAFPLPPVLPGSLLPSHRLVAYYGNPLSGAMGILGELPDDQMLARLQDQANAYAQANPKTPVQPALELVATVAQAGPGPDGLYRQRMDPSLIEQEAQLAQSKGAILILDLQIGRSSVAEEVNAMLPFLKRPYVHLALDPEFAMGPGQLPGQVFGSMDASAINGAIATLTNLVEANHLPPKVLIVHRFIEEMVTNYKQIHPVPQVEVAMDMDGFGSPENKISKYQLYVHDQRVEYSGIKLFYKQDALLMSPAKVLSLDPVPNVVIYQ